MFQRIIGQTSDSAYAHHNLGVCYFMQGRYDAGLKQCLRAIELKPDYVMAMQKAALACVDLGRWREAREIIERALAVEPANDAMRQLRRRLWRRRLAWWSRRLIGWFRA